MLDKALYKIKEIIVLLKIVEIVTSFIRNYF